jgi:hypothetical protein
MGRQSQAQGLTRLCQPVLPTYDKRPFAAQCDVFVDVVHQPCSGGRSEVAGDEWLTNHIAIRTQAMSRACTRIHARVQ